VDTEQFKKQSGILCALCGSSERNERVVKKIIKAANNYLSEVDNQKLLKHWTLMNVDKAKPETKSLWF
jgi:hypothetical protein